MIRSNLLGREAALLGALVAVFLVFSFLVGGFLNWFNLLERTRYWVVPGMIAVPMTFIIATGGIDLSVGSMVALCGIALGLLYQEWGWPMAMACVAAVAVGALAGGVNGWASSFLRIPPLVVTLATMTLFRGIAMGLSKGDPIRNLPEGFTWLSWGDVLTVEVTDAASIYFPVPLFPFLVVMGLGAFLLRQSWIGRFTECIGENEVAARFAAIDVRWMKLGLYAACGAVCGLASILHTALYATAKADTAMGMELEVIACVVVGGTRISGGQASMAGTLLGLLLIGILRYGLEMAGWPLQYIVIVVGCLLVVAAVFNERMAIRKGERL